MAYYNTVSTPMETCTKLTKSDIWTDANGDQPLYHELDGYIMYLAVAARPHIAHAASDLNQFNDAFGNSHWTAAKSVLRYLKGTADLENKIFEGFVDADYACGGSIGDRCFYTGYVFLMSLGAISWESRKQRTLAVSTTEAEYMAVSDATEQVLHLRRFLLELGVPEAQTVKLYNDTFCAQKLALNPVFHPRTKHIDIRHHFVLEVDHASSSDMIAVVFMKALTKNSHERCTKSLGLLNNL